MNIPVLSPLKFLFLLIALLIYVISCDRKADILSPTSEVKELTFSNKLTGQVFLENQIEHSNCLIFIDSLAKGLGSDSNGTFTFKFDEADTIYSGKYKIRFFLYDYSLDSLSIALCKGQVIWDSLDVMADGTLKEMVLKQLIEVTCSVDTPICRPGDSVFVTGSVRNVSTKSTVLNVPEGAVNNGLGYLGFFHSPDHYSFGVPRFDGTLHPLEWEWLIEPHEIYETSKKIEIPVGDWRNGIFYPMQAGEYIVAPSFLFPSQDSLLTAEMRLFIRNNWDEIHRGEPPCYSLVPNKYKYGKIMVSLD